MKRFVYNQKYSKMVISMMDQTTKIEALAKQHDLNTGHLRIVIDQWTKEGVIVKSKAGKEYSIRLTDKGAQIAEKLSELIQIIENYTPTIAEPEEEENDATEPESSTVQS